MQTALLLEGLRITADEWPHNPQLLSAVIDVIAALASHGSATAVAAAQQQSSSSIDAADLVYETYAILFTGACHLTCTIRDSGQMARLSDADALRFGSALSLAVRGMPVLLRGFVEHTQAYGDVDPAAAPAGSLLSHVEKLINMGTCMLYNGVLDVLAGPSQPGLQQHLSPRVQRALRASMLQPQQLAGWLDSTVAAARTLFHLKGEQEVKAPVLKTFIQLWAMGDLPTAQLVQGTSLQADVFSLLADCTIALKQRLEAARPEPISHEDLKKLMVLVAGMNHSGLLSARKQFMGNIPAGTALLEAAASLFVALPLEPAEPAAPGLVDSLGGATLNLAATIGFLAGDVTEACYAQQAEQVQQAQQAEQAQQQEQMPQQAQQQEHQQEQAATGGMSEACVHLAAAVVRKQHWLLNELAAALAAAAEAMLRMHPLFAQLASTVCAEVPAGSEVASLAAGLPGQQAAKASSPSSSGKASSGRDAMSGSTALGETAARAACLPRFLALLATKMAARIAVYAAAHGSEDDERIQRMLDCAALLALEQLPLAEEVNANPALDVFDVTRAWSEQMCLLCLLLRTQRTQALALAHGAGAAVGRALAGALVSSSWD
ncbi:hypothetical protein COHA_010331 [Chlorella ohadii]|uniref:Uncharacterized protein n=1 Tax=Chlorella ohadii TaxID=2649997 RepID=A0AAD5DG26_9CHLO|nr:hypothetical protein COHA_010331 [Chlorella ohadii]